MSMVSLQWSLPRLEELRFPQAIQWTTCLNPGDATIGCTLHTHSLICHSKAHTINQCEYNLLNKVVALIRQIQPWDDCHEDWNRSVHWFWEEDWSRYDDRYQLNRWDDYRRDDWYHEYWHRGGSTWWVSKGLSVQWWSRIFTLTR